MGMGYSGVRARWYRLTLCLLCFVCGCALSFSFLSSLECQPSPTTDRHHSNVPRIVKDGEKPAAVRLVILILSAPGNLQRRHTVRRTWLTLVDRKLIKYYFVIGQKSVSEEVNKLLLSEGHHYSDLLILPEVEEGYESLANKVLKSLVWVYENLDFEHVLKVDDDSFVDARRLVMELKEKHGGDLLYWGYFNGHAQVQHRGKWKDSQWNLCDRYLPYARGGGYILSRSVVQFLSQNAPVLQMFKNEDVSVGLWLAPLKVARLHDVRFDTEWTSRGCSNQYLVTHPHNEAEIQKLHDVLSGFGKLCSVEYQKRPAYSYDWSTLPSQCCINKTS